MNIGFFYAIASAIAWGSYLVPFKKSQSSNFTQFQMLMTIGIILFSIVSIPFLNYSFNVNLFGLISGIMWASANAISLYGVRDLGLSRFVPISVSLVIFVSFLWGAFVFHELSAGFLTGIVGIVLIIVGVILIGTIGNTQSENVKRGIILSVVAGIIWGSQLVPLRLGNLTPSDFFFSMSLGIALFGIAYFFHKRESFRNEAVGNSILSGILWSIGNLLSIITVSLIGLAKGFPLTQASVLIAVIWGVFYFKEITKSSDIRKILIGSVILMAGVVILGLA